jgi:hypothetical protein
LYDALQRGYLAMTAKSPTQLKKPQTNKQTNKEKQTKEQTNKQTKKTNTLSSLINYTVNTYFYMVNIVLVVKLFYFYDILLK